MCTIPEQETTILMLFDAMLHDVDHLPTTQHHYLLTYWTAFLFFMLDLEYERSKHSALESLFLWSTRL